MSKLMKSAALAALLAAAVVLAVAAHSELATESPRSHAWVAVSSFARQAERQRRSFRHSRCETARLRSWTS
jgi:hypothetical protein